MKSARTTTPTSPRQRRAVRLIASGVMALGGAMLLKAVLTVMSDTAWEDGFSAAREAQPLEYWAFVVTWLALGAGTVWLGISLWRTP